MINETITRIEQEISTNTSITAEQKQDLIDLIAGLKKEIATLGETHYEDASSIANYTETSFHEAMREKLNPELLTHSLEGMSLSARSFEVSHPKLIGVINNIGRTLMNIGI